MDNKPHKIFNFDEHYIEKICTHLENGMLFTYLFNL